MGLHALAATMLKEPVLAISSQEGEALASNLIDISEYYGLTASKGIMLWINLAGCAAMIYAPRIYTIAQRPKKPKINTQVNPGHPDTAAPINQAGGTVLKFE